MSQEPKAEKVAELQQQKKRLKSASNRTVSEFICAITHELPVDPVIAEDGQVYERRAIEAWIAQAAKNNKPVRSPNHNTEMGPRLLPATQVRNAIEHLVRADAINGPVADAWMKKIAFEGEVNAMVKRAETNDGDAMYNLGLWYNNGHHGLAVDSKKAVSWYQRGHNLGHATCTSALGLCYEEGVGVRRDVVYAVCLYSIAAARGSEAGCHNLAIYLSAGHGGLRENESAATHWFRAAVRAPVRDASASARDTIATWLHDHDAA